MGSCFRFYLLPFCFSLLLLLSIVYLFPTAVAPGRRLYSEPSRAVSGGIVSGMIGVGMICSLLLNQLIGWPRGCWKIIGKLMCCFVCNAMSSGLFGMGCVCYICCAPLCSCLAPCCSCLDRACSYLNNWFSRTTATTPSEQVELF